MVRNTLGGNRMKSQARKNFVSGGGNGETVSQKTRLSQNEFEKYAEVIRLYGNGRILIRTQDNIEMQCVIRNKFRGKSKRDNHILLGTILLIGIRQWQTIQNICDVLEVYDTIQINHIITQWNPFQSYSFPFLDHSILQIQQQDLSLIHI